MKIALLNDTHFGARNDSPAFLEYFMRFYNEIFFPYCKENNIKKVMILGSSGLKEDHSMANVLIASTYSDILHIELITSFYRIIFVRKNTKINAPNAPVSIISLSSDNKITTSGLKYDLNNEKLKSFSHGISNEVNGDSFTVKAESTIVVFIGIK